MDTTVKPVLLQDLTERPKGDALLEGRLDLIRDVQVKLDVVVGRAEITVEELMQLKDASVVKLDRRPEDPVEVLLDGRVVARGELVVLDEQFGVRITELVER
jgi:flagellar motor switch protein FliN/FliY